MPSLRALGDHRRPADDQHALAALVEHLAHQADQASVGMLDQQGIDHRSGEQQDAPVPVFDTTATAAVDLALAA
jgi:hypothetical protein